MFGFGKNVQDVVVEKEEVPRGEIPKLSEGFRAQVAKYQEVASRVGFAPGSLVEEQIALFCADNQIPVYDLDRVEDFLDRKAAADKEANGHWHWVPLRESDANKLTYSGHRNTYARKNSVARNYDNNGIIAGGVLHYNALVPMPILERVERIQRAFPQLNFFVSDIAPEADPFIAVSEDGMSMIIFGQWNEPDFEC